MDAATLTTILHNGFGATARVRARRPNVLYQLNIPAYLSDGDAAAIFVRPLENSRILMTDLGHVCMRLSYTRKVTGRAHEALEKLARRHGFSVVEDQIVCEMPLDEMLAGAIGLIQVQSEAEASIAATVARGDRRETFRAAVREALREAFSRACEFDFHDPADTEGLYKIDAYIRLPERRDIGIAITPTNIDAERAVSAKLHLKSVISGKPLWIAIPRNTNELDDRTRLRLMEGVPRPCAEI